MSIFGKMRRIVSAMIMMLATLMSVQAKTAFGSQDYVQTLKKATDIMVNDVTSPVAASRYYAYICLAANEVQAAYCPSKHFSFAKKLNGFAGIETVGLPVKQGEASLSTILAVLKMGEKLLPSGYLLRQQIDSILAIAPSKGIPQKQLENSVVVTEAIVNQLLVYIKKDGFTTLSGLPRYTPKQGPEWWQPTPPAFMAPVEPHWRNLRSFVLDSAQQFKPLPPNPYSTDPSSQFYLEMEETYETVKRADKAEQDIAMFWDCNPFAVQQMGHINIGIKKISPGGHWMGITGIACLQQGFSLRKTTLAHALVAISLADAFIACWDEKYRSNRVRPETAIHALLDPRWQPLLQTPPFPEYVSGHSVASHSAAKVLTRVFGANFKFDDDSEVEFGLPVRQFPSFQAAADEAAISRLYGGIHYRDGIVQGTWQGQQVGKWAVGKLADAFGNF
ncbi:MAG: vanadium-dependent haloperoxidase [Saprospiraceae bacterium]|nr:vanadium-dependent haloperoxidase [Saprospiraceae bacterium]